MSACLDPSDAVVVVSRHANVLRPWADRLRAAGFRVVVYEKHPALAALGPPFVRHAVPANRGNEASAFLQYIVESYDSMPRHVVLLHDHDRSWHHDGSIVDAVLARTGRPVDGGLANLNSFRLGSIRTSALWPQVRAWFDRFLAPYLGAGADAFGDWTVGRLGCSQYVVASENVRRRPRRMYEDLLRWLLTTPLDDATSGRFLEWTWDLMWRDGGVVR